MRDKFIEELIAQPSQNNGIQGTKINIHLTLRGEIMNYCIDLNQKIQKVTNSGIDFSPSSFQIPHITLYMGYVNNKENYILLMHKILEFAKQIKSINIIPQKPYIKTPKKNYIFIDTEQSDEIIKLKYAIKEKVEDLMEPLTWDVVNEIPHITVGYIKDDFDKVKELLENYPAGRQWIADCVEVSFSGSWGSCIGSIRTFEIPN